MKFSYSTLYLSAGDTVEVEIDRSANVLLLDWSNFYNYKNEMSFSYYGGYQSYSPVYITAPYSGTWYLVIDLANAGESSRVRFSYSVIPANDGHVSNRERARIEAEIRSKEAILDEFRDMHPRKKSRIRAMENEIEGLKKFLKNW